MSMIFGERLALKQPKYLQKYIYEQPKRQVRQSQKLHGKIPGNFISCTTNRVEGAACAAETPRRKSMNGVPSLKLTARP